MARCMDGRCPFISETIGDLKKYPIDRLEVIEYIIGSATANDNNFVSLCKPCFEKMCKDDEWSYNYMKTPYIPITWEDPYGKNSNNKQTIDNFITINNFNTSNLTNNNTNNNTNNINHIVNNNNIDKDFFFKTRKSYDTLYKEYEETEKSKTDEE